MNNDSIEMHIKSNCFRFIINYITNNRSGRDRLVANLAKITVSYHDLVDIKSVDPPKVQSYIFEI